MKPKKIRQGFIKVINVIRPLAINDDLIYWKVQEFNCKI